MCEQAPVLLHCAHSQAFLGVLFFSLPSLTHQCCFQEIYKAHGQISGTKVTKNGGGRFCEHTTCRCYDLNMFYRASSVENLIFNWQN